jgi:uncharacterized membrane protein (DUF485 family)
MDNASPPPLNDPAWRAAIGPRADRYLAVFQKIEAGGGGWVANWNWAAFATSTFWFCYRRMPLLALVYLPFIPLIGFFTPLLEMGIFPDPVAPFIPGIALSVYILLAFVAVPVYADALYYRRLKRQLAAHATARETIAALAPSWTAAIRSFLLGGLAVGMIPIGITAKMDFESRVKVSDAIIAAVSTRDAVTEFHKRNNRLPAQNEIAGLPAPPASRPVQSVKWEPDTQRIVITLDGTMAGKRLALQAELRDGAITWKCHTIDASPRVLPATCRH